MSKYNPTVDQQTAIDAEGKILVSASAGSGKTTTMLNRIERLLRAGVPLKRMLILVYNTATADELKEKLRDLLFRCACEGGESAQSFRKQLDEISLTTIGTIHSFCSTLIRKNFEKAEVAPDFRVLDERQHAGYMSDALDKTLEEYAEKNDRLFFDLTSIFEYRRNEDNFRSNVIKLFQIIDVQSDENEFVQELRGYYRDPQKFEEIILQDSKRIMTEVLEGIDDLLQTLIRLRQDGYADNIVIVKRIAQLFFEGDFDKIVSVANGDAVFVKARKRNDKTFSPEDNILLGESVEDAKNRIAAVTNELARYSAICPSKEQFDRVFKQNKLLQEKLVEITLRFKRILQEMKDKDGVLSFGDLEHRAVKLIDGGEDFSKDYDYVFVDEYQDANPAQEYIISHVEGSNPFMVGDVKQSIYGFRLADPKNFLKRAERYESQRAQGENARVINFNVNFRSENQILQFVNGVFDKIMTKDKADVDYKDEKVRFAENSSKNGWVQIHVFTSQPAEKQVAKGLYNLRQHVNREKEESKSEMEGRFIAAEIKRLKGSVYRDRTLEYGDFAILFRKRNGAEKILSAIKDAGIPIDDGSFSKDCSRPEKDLITFLNVLDNPRQDYPLACYLLSYLGGFDEAELVEISAHNGEGILYDGLLATAKEDTALGNKVRNALDIIENYRVKACFYSVPQLLGSLIADYSYDAFLMSEGEAIVNSLHSFLASIRDDENSFSLGAFLRSYHEIGMDNSGKSVGGDRVHVSTFHGYKGLEKPVVFVANTNSQARRGDAGDLIINQDGAIGLSYFDGDTKRKNQRTLSNEAVSVLIENREYKERMRLLYVALTRAQLALYVTGSVSGNGLDREQIVNRLTAAYRHEKTDLEFMVSQIKNDENAKLFIHSEAEQISTENPPVLTGFSQSLKEKIESAQAFEYPHKEATTLAMKYSVSALEKSDDEDFVRIYEDKTNVGTAYHKVMEYVDFSKRSVDEIVLQVNEMVQNGALELEERRLVDPYDIAKALASDVMKYASKCVCLREKPFMMYRKASEVVLSSQCQDKVLVQGVIDLLVQGDKTIIVDYKYSSLMNDQALEKYKRQLYLYKMAAENAFSVKVDEVILLSLKTGKTLKVEL